MISRSALHFPPPEVFECEMQRRRKNAPVGIGDFDDVPALSAIASRLEPDLRRRFEHAVRRTQARLSLEELAHDIRVGNVRRIESLVDAPAFARDVEEQFVGVLQSGFLRGAEFAQEQLNSVGLGINFDLINPYAVSFVQNHVPQLANDFGQTMGRSVQQVLEQAFEHGIPPEEAAQKMRDVIGLTDGGIRQVDRLEQRLRDLGASEETIAVQRGKLSAALLRRRAITIARTELIRAHNEGQYSLWSVAEMQGLLDKTLTRRKWIAALDDRIDQEICLPLDDKETGMDEPFEVNGRFIFNPPAHPNCRCAVGLVFVEVTEPEEEVRVAEELLGHTERFGGTVAQHLAAGYDEHDKVNTFEGAELAVKRFVRSDALRRAVRAHIGADPSKTRGTFIKNVFLDVRNHPDAAARQFFEENPTIAGVATWHDEIVLNKSHGQKIWSLLYKDGKLTTPAQRLEILQRDFRTAEAIHTLAHEYTHMQAVGRSVVGYDSLSKELIEEGLNELVTQHTLPAFVSTFVGQAVDLGSLSFPIQFTYSYTYPVSVVRKLANLALKKPLNATASKEQLQVVSRWRFQVKMTDLQDKVLMDVIQAQGWPRAALSEFREGLREVAEETRSIEDVVNGLQLKYGRKAVDGVEKMMVKAFEQREAEILRLLATLSLENARDVAARLREIIEAEPNEQDRRQLEAYWEWYAMAVLALERKEKESG